jgi:hypothetical protein
MTNYHNDIMDLLQGETPKQKYEFLKELLKPKEKKFEAGAKARIKDYLITQHPLSVGCVVTLFRKANLQDSIWLCKNEFNNSCWVHEDEMELI